MRVGDLGEKLKFERMGGLSHHFTQSNTMFINSHGIVNGVIWLHLVAEHLIYQKLAEALTTTCMLSEVRNCSKCSQKFCTLTIGACSKHIHFCAIPYVFNESMVVFVSPYPDCFLILPGGQNMASSIKDIFHVNDPSSSIFFKFMQNLSSGFINNCRWQGQKAMHFLRCFHIVDCVSLNSQITW